MDRKLHLLDSFTAQGTDGRLYKVKAFEQLVRDPSLADGLDHWEPTGVAELHLDSGELVDMRADGRMRVVATGMELVRP
ncbi:hypothetical protein [Caldimonas taiwanensis]|uniref:hypothetical protein n=1 Tax=Caldimonas taiwanensis TaxID=307483 RepID=UPI0012FBD336|nr:hypothetical protein [Caldimonas taiwanensis]